MSHRYDLGADYWTTPDKRLLRARRSRLIAAPCCCWSWAWSRTEIYWGKLRSFFSAHGGRTGALAVSKGAMYPCQTAEAAYLLCRMGHAEDGRIQKRCATFWIHSIRTGDGGATSFHSGGGRKQSIPIPCYTDGAGRVPFSSYLNNDRRWIGRWIFCWSTGL